MKVSVILPTYNEAGNIVPLIETLRNLIQPPWEYELIVVDDNSPDGTLDRVKTRYGNDPRVKTILRTADRGLAASLHAGIDCATGDYILMMDSDFTHPPEDVPLMLHVAEKVDLVNGSRFCAGGRMPSKSRYLASFLFNCGLRLLLGSQIQDQLNGFCVVRTELIKRLPLNDIFFGYGDCHTRLLFYLQRIGAKIVEVPVRYGQRRSGRSKSNLPKMFIQYSARAFALALKRGTLKPGK